MIIIIIIYYNDDDGEDNDNYSFLYYLFVYCLLFCFPKIIQIK